VVGVLDAPQDVTLTGYSGNVTVEAYDGDPSWVGFPLVSGRWFARADEVVAASGLLRTTGHQVGDFVTLSSGHAQHRVRIVGEAFDLNWRGLVVLAGTSTLTGLTQDVTATRFDVALTTGTSPDAYVASLSTTLGTQADVSVRQEQNAATTFAILIGLIGTLTLLLSTVAALGVFNTAMLNTRERVHEIGVLKTLGMTPHQVRWLVTASMAAIGLPAGLLATPLGDLLQRRVLPVMADAAGTRIPSSFINVYRPIELAVLAGAGLLLAVLGAAVPASWAAGTRVATALRAE
jgi:putative ABC transport system permease protein